MSGSGYVAYFTFLNWTENICGVDVFFLKHGGWYLFDAALGGAEHEEDIARDQHHRRQSHEPTNHLAPHWVNILPQGQRGHLNSTEGKHPL